MGSKITENLFLGGIEALDECDDCKISHILTIDIVSPHLKSTNILKHHVIDITDEEHSDLLSSLPTALHFIEDCHRDHGRVLVHCRHGVSRSATVVIAWIMKHKEMSVDNALAMVQSIRPQVKPNNGFMRQLMLFEMMQYSVNPLFPKYILFLAQQDSPGLLTKDVTYDASLSRMKFKCRKCRGLICVGDQVIDHTTGVSPDWSLSFCEPPYCLKGVFIVDPQMVVTRPESLLSRTTEKYNCIKCGSKIGNIGLASCGCGASVSRGIWINSSKVDKSRH